MRSARWRSREGGPRVGRARGADALGGRAREPGLGASGARDATRTTATRATQSLVQHRVEVVVVAHLGREDFGTEAVAAWGLGSVVAARGWVTAVLETAEATTGAVVVTACAFEGEGGGLAGSGAGLDGGGAGRAAAATAVVGAAGDGATGPRAQGGADARVVQRSRGLRWRAPRRPVPARGSEMALVPAWCRAARGSPADATRVGRRCRGDAEIVARRRWSDVVVQQIEIDVEGVGVVELDQDGASRAASTLGGAVGSSPKRRFARCTCRLYVPFSISRTTRIQYEWNVL